ncbi:Glycoside hydrolase [Mycena venus]|uniref:Glycoside hydrolase n=1 Tax=Mycena venus TaxID=2733690 RepID=A0A8H6XLC8_9AGAR|nr:Glycoside hydrolase [Mycena venus]
MSKQKVLILGATGHTGESILQGLLKDTESFQEVEALVRPASAEKPEVKKIAEMGVKIHVVDIGGPLDELVNVLTGIDVLISAIDPMGQLAELKLVTAAKKAGVKRFVPCAFITVAPPGGVMTLRDNKEEVYQEIWKQFLPYTVIDVGYWHQLSFPTLPSGRVDYASAFIPKVEIHAGGTAPTMLTDLRDIGNFVALIIKDPRTLNKFVCTYSDALSENEIFAMMEELSGEKIERKHISAEDIIASCVSALAASKAEPENLMAQAMKFIAEYEFSKYVRTDNTPEYAKYLGYLDARELYPEFKPKTFREFLGELFEGKVENPYKRSRN